MARFCSFFSSSSGNSTYFGTASSGILIDAGVSCKRLCSALKNRDIEPERLSAIFVTHSHTDHISGIKLFASRYGIPVYCTEGTAAELEAAEVTTGKFPLEIMPQTGIEAGGMEIKSFPVPHDTAQPCGYTLLFPDGRKAAIATDTGHMTDIILNEMKKCDLVMMESNHDVGMLQNGPYPYALKRRILSPTGHLCNDDCASAAVQLVKSGVTRLFLGHLSTENNIPGLAFEATHAALTMSGASLDIDYTLCVNKKENDGGIVLF